MNFVKSVRKRKKRWILFIDTYPFYIMLQTKKRICSPKPYPVIISPEINFSFFFSSSRGGVVGSCGGSFFLSLKLTIKSRIVLVCTCTHTVRSVK